MFALKKLLTALILPPIGTALLALIALWLLLRQSPIARWRVWLLACSIALPALLAFEPVSLALAQPLEQKFSPVNAAQLARAQAYVVLGGGLAHAAPEYGAEDMVSAGTLQRVRYAATLYRRHKLPILVSGGSAFGHVQQTEAASMRTALREYGVPVRWLEEQSRDTLSNAHLAALFLRDAGISRIALVTHALHMRRARLAFAREGFEIIPAPLGFSTPAPTLAQRWLPRAAHFSLSVQALHEWLGLLMV